MTVTDSPPGQLEIPRTPADVIAIARQIGEAAAPHAARHDREASFVAEGFEAVRALGYGVIAVPRELGGAGHDLATVCQAQAIMARYCANTALAIAMHQHNVLAMSWRWRLGDHAVERILRRIAAGNFILSSSGAVNPANPGVTATPVDGGLLVSGAKRFVSGVPGADVIVTMARVDDGEQRWTTTVIIPTSDPGTEIIDDWDAMGMRGSGSNPVRFSEVFVPEANTIEFERIGLLTGRRRGNRAGGRGGGAPNGRQGDGDGGQAARPRGDQGGAPAGVRPTAQPRVQHIDGHRLPGLQIALAVIAATYLGAAGGVRDRALRMAAAAGAGDDPVQQRLAGLMTHEFRSARWALGALIADTTDESVGTEDHFLTTMLAKRQVILSSIRIVELAMELLGSRSYMRGLPFEQALRDVRAGITHPLSPERTLVEVGRSALEFHGRQPQA
jgi:alkylation response protein AidB-like acyl-CoA dehydrogenase